MNSNLFCTHCHEEFFRANNNLQEANNNLQEWKYHENFYSEYMWWVTWIIWWIEFMTWSKMWECDQKGEKIEVCEVKWWEPICHILSVVVIYLKYMVMQLFFSSFCNSSKGIRNSVCECKSHWLNYIKLCVFCDFISVFFFIFSAICLTKGFWKRIH